MFALRAGPRRYRSSAHATGVKAKPSMDIVGRYEDVFCNAVIDKGDGTTSEDSKLFETMKDAFSRLRNHPRGRERILSLLGHKNSWVKSWVATQILSEGENSAAEIALEEIVIEAGVIGFGAETVLDQYKSGELKSPFGIVP